jgi:hypothetical protein
MTVVTSDDDGQLVDETKDDEEQEVEITMEGELLTRCLLHLHGILHLGDLLTLRSRGLGLGLLRSLGRGVRFIHNVVGVGGFGYHEKRREKEKEDILFRKACVEPEASATRLLWLPAATYVSTESLLTRKNRNSEWKQSYSAITGVFICILEPK